MAGLIMEVAIPALAPAQNTSIQSPCPPNMLCLTLFILKVDANEVNEVMYW